MSLLIQCTPSRWVDFLTIPDDAKPTCSGADVDLFVGKNKSVTITLRNGSETRFRDIVVLGELILQSSDPENTAVKPNLIARDVISAGKTSLNNINLTNRNTLIPENNEKLQQDLNALFWEWRKFQKESVERMGLRSILA